MKIPFLNGLCKEDDPHSQGNWEVDLTGDGGEWTVTITGPGKYEKWEGEWDAAHQEIAVMGLNTHDLPLSQRLVFAAQAFLRSHIEKVFTPEQTTLVFTGEKACCQCGLSETAGFIKGPNDGTKYPKPEPVTWVCVTCDGLVCRNCCLTVPNSKPKQYYDNALCSELCLACAPTMVAWESKMNESGPFAKTKRRA